MTAFGTIYYARKFVKDERLEDSAISRCQDGLYRVFVDTGFRVDATRTTCANINSRFNKSLRFRLDHKSGSYRILAPYDHLEAFQVNLSRYKGEGCNCIWRDQRNINSQENG